MVHKIMAWINGLFRDEESEPAIQFTPTHKNIDKSFRNLKKQLKNRRV